MGNSTTRAVLGAAVLGLLSVSPAMAADLVLKVGAGSRSVAVTNTSSTAMTLLYLKSPDDMNLPVYAHLGQGATVDVPLRFVMPDGVNTAVAEIDKQRRPVTVEVLK